MPQENNIAKLVAIGALCLAVGIGAGYFLKASDAKVKKAVKFEPVVNVLSSKVIQSAMAYGQVTKINGNLLTLSAGGQDVPITVQQGAEVYSNLNAKPQANGFAVPKQASLADVRLGDYLSINLAVGQDGTISADRVYIFFRQK